MEPRRTIFIRVVGLLFVAGTMCAGCGGLTTGSGENAATGTGSGGTGATGGVTTGSSGSGASGGSGGSGGTGGSGVGGSGGGTTIGVGGVGGTTGGTGGAGRGGAAGTTGQPGQTAQCGAVLCKAVVGGPPPGMQIFAPCCAMDKLNTCGGRSEAAVCLSLDPGTVDANCPSVQWTMYNVTSAGCCRPNRECGVDLSAFGFGCNDATWAGGKGGLRCGPDGG